MRTVGVIGGMGPAATLDFLTRLHAATPAARDQDHLRVITDSNPQVPDRNAALRGDGPSPGPTLAAMARGLERAGADLLAMPCNAAHGWDADIRAAVSIPFVSMIDAAIEATTTAVPRGSRVGVLAVDATIDAALYQPKLAEAGFDVLQPDRAAFMTLIYRIKAGDTGVDVRAAMIALGHRMASDGAALILIACTEVPLVVGSIDLPVITVNATDALVRRVIAEAK